MSFNPSSKIHHPSWWCVVKSRSILRCSRCLRIAFCTSRVSADIVVELVVRPEDLSLSLLLLSLAPTIIVAHVPYISVALFLLLQYLRLSRERDGLSCSRSIPSIDTASFVTPRGGTDDATAKFSSCPVLCLHPSPASSRRYHICRHFDNNGAAWATTATSSRQRGHRITRLAVCCLLGRKFDPERIVCHSTIRRCPCRPLKAICRSRITARVRHIFQDSRFGTAGSGMHSRKACLLFLLCLPEWCQRSTLSMIS